jgi:hypothetical protein
MLFFFKKNLKKEIKGKINPREATNPNIVGWKCIYFLDI